MSITGPLKIAVIGAGDFGQRYIRAITDSPVLDLVGVAERDATRREEMAYAFGAKMFASASDLLKGLGTENVDGLVLCTPPAAHLEDLKIAVSARIPSLVEKPIVSDRQGLDYLFSLDVEQRSRIVPAHLSRHLDAVRFLRRALKDQEIILINAWRYVPRDRLSLHGGDHPALSAMIHDFDLVRAVTDSPVVSLHVTSARSDSALRFPDTVIATFTLESGTIVCVGNSWTLPNSSRYVEATFEVVTNDEKFVLTTPSDSLVVRSRNGDIFPAAELGLLEDSAYGGAFERQLNHFSSVISGRVEAEVTVEDAEWGIGLALDISHWAERPKSVLGQSPLLSSEEEEPSVSERPSQ